ncbi:hypothetical protein CRI94_04505 [Longibacter salinarum]|uniref:Cytoplasmic protein n=1 Tax=Longibacter salinarum TaxID=1850348 RepID=A0A2A8D089_9BACT|nr:DUF4385 domain-containing protein [Longibacter salinarum]PEN14304.1 hypothetical protein CRI94_04505 [Longibacter salinarum]
MPVEYDIDFRSQPEAYRYSSDERGVFKVEPYKSELLPHWSYVDAEAAEKSVAAIQSRYLTYRDANDFVGMDMARKYLQMGFTRAMRYAKYPGGKKYDDDGEKREPQEWADPDKREAAVIFRQAWQEVREDDLYQERKQRHVDEVFEPEVSPM